MISSALLKHYETQESWLQYESHLHGIAHMTRVLILQELIAKEVEKEGIKLNREALRWAASTHDVGRREDGLDPGHGSRSAKWVKAHLKGRVDSDTLQLICELNTLHDQEALSKLGHSKELAVLKDADALDRVRIKDLDENRLRFTQSRKLIYMAEELCKLSMAHPAITANPFQAAMDTAEILGLTG